MRIPFGMLCKTVLAWNPFSLATIGICVFCALTSVGAFFIYWGGDEIDFLIVACYLLQTKH